MTENAVLFGTVGRIVQLSSVFMDAHSQTSDTITLFYSCDKLVPACFRL